MEVLPDRIIVKSPGEPKSPITMESLKNFTATSYSSNKKLIFIFNEMSYMEESALGMDTFKSLREKFDLPLPIMDYDGSNIVVTFPRTTEAIKEVSSRKGIDKLNVEELIGYEWIKVVGKTTRMEYEIYFGYNDKKAERHLKNMVELQLLEKKGAGRNTYYEINPT